MTVFAHVPVLHDAVLRLLRPKAGERMLDATIGGAGHAAALAERLAPNGRLIGFDQDERALDAARRKLAGAPVEVILVKTNFRHLSTRLTELGESPLDGILFDLGTSSPQLDEPERGFTYWGEGPLDMRMDPEQPMTAEQLLAEASEDELVRILWEYGEERWARRIARFIVEGRARRPIRTAADLVELIKAAIPAASRRSGPHPARRTFQALRIAVNDELGALQEGLNSALDWLAPGGRLAVISFHSLEDRIVKRTFAAAAAGCICPPGLPVCACGREPRVDILTPKPLQAEAEELARNPRARSARLRAVVRR